MPAPEFLADLLSASSSVDLVLWGKVQRWKDSLLLMSIGTPPLHVTNLAGLTNQKRPLKCDYPAATGTGN